MAGLWQRKLFWYNLRKPCTSQFSLLISHNAWQYCWSERVEIQDTLFSPCSGCDWLALVIYPCLVYFVLGFCRIKWLMCRKMGVLVKKGWKELGCRDWRLDIAAPCQGGRWSSGNSCFWQILALKVLSSKSHSCFSPPRFSNLFLKIYPFINKIIIEVFELKWTCLHAPSQRRGVLKIYETQTRPQVNFRVNRERASCLPPINFLLAGVQIRSE